jgi:glycosyltransferase involved in cell wall biosynthesis
MRITVVVPTIDRFDYLREALQSIADQEIPVDEVLVSDNGPRISADNIVAEFPGLPIRHVVHAKRMPIDEHWLWAFGAARGDYVCLLEDDNLWRKGHLLGLVAALDQYPQVPVACSGAIEVRETKGPLQTGINAPLVSCDLLRMGPVHLGREAALATFLFNTDATSSTFMWKKSIFDQISPTALGVSSSHDRWLWAQLSAQGGMVYVPHLSVIYRQHEAMLSQAINGAKYRGEQNRIARCILDLAASHGLSPQQLFDALRLHLTAEAVGELIRNVVRDRDRFLWDQLLPPLLCSASPWAKWRAVISGLVYWGERKIRRRLGLS